MKKYKRTYFTLIELLAAMAVFSILLVVAMRLFSGAQQIWLRSEDKTDTFASARVAMEYISSRLQTMNYVDDEPFEIEEGEPEKDKANASGYECDTIWFLSEMASGGRGHYHQFIKLRLVDPTDKDHDFAGVLQLLMFSSGKKGFNFWQLLPPYSSKRYRGKTVFSTADARKEINKVFDELEEDDDPPNTGGQKAVDLIENVVSFKLDRYVVSSDTDTTLTKRSANNNVNSAPYLIEVELKMLDSHESFVKWQNAATQNERDNIFIEHGYTFRRAILLGKRGNE